MLQAARGLQEMTSGTTQESFFEDLKLQWAVTRGIGIIGEAAARIGDDVRQKHPELPWANMIGMRNILIHAYFDVDLETVFGVIVNDLPRLILQIEAILSQDSSTP